MINTIEFYCGTKSFSKVAASYGMTTFTLDNNKRFKPDYLCNIFDVDLSRMPSSANIIWASHPCTYFSCASMWRHWNKDGSPASVFAEQGLKMLDHTLWLVSQIPHDVFILENPVGKMRSLPAVQNLHRHTVTYCCYGDLRMKPTDLFCNVPLTGLLSPCGFKKRCPVTMRTNDLSTASQRSVIPAGLINSVLKCLPNIICQAA
jgi:hypothetical protein